MNNGYLSVRPPHPGTCDWFFETDQFRHWRDHSQTAEGNLELRVQGGPGTGKSTLMKHILNYCHKEMHDHVILSHFFHDRGKTSENSLLNMMRSLVHQSLHQEIELSEQCIKFVQMGRLVENKEDWQWQLGELEELLLLALQSPLPKPVIVIIDAIDECEVHETRRMIRLLNNLLYLKFDRDITIKLCYTGRSPNDKIPLGWADRSLDVKLPMREGVGINLDDLNSRDIMLYIEERLTHSIEYAGKELLKKSSGCFLWVVIVVALLNKRHFAGDDDATTLKILDGIPQDLSEVFNMLLLQNDQEIGDRAFLVQLVLLSRRSLKPEELCAVIGKVPANNESIERHISNLSHGLVEVRQEGTAIVQFIHHTVQDFMRLKDTWQALDPGSDDNPTRAGHVRLWERCRECMQSFMESPIQKHDMQAPGDRHPFFSYAIENILYHAEMEFSEVKEGRAVPKEPIVRWLQNYNHWFNWLKRWRRIESEVGLLYVLATDGFPNLAEFVLMQGADVNAKGGLYGNALQAAVSRGNEEVVKRLLKYGADVNAQGGSYGSALQAALYRGKEEITKLLFEGGTSVDGQGRRYINSIQAAAAVSEASEDMIDLLLHRGADINAGDGSHGNAVQVAIFEGNLSTLKILLQRGANIHAWGGFHGNALQAAAYTGNEEAITLLLDCGADVNAEGGHYGSALQAAAAQKFHKVVKLLISNGADIYATGGEYGSALCAAAHEGSLVIVESLLDEGADPDIQVDYYGNALQAAAYQGHFEVVQSLLWSDANIDAQGGRYGNALCAALAAANDGIIEYLLRHRARTDLRDSSNRTALHYAVESGSHSLVQLILEKGASPDNLDDAKKSPLDIAVQSGDAHLIHQLISRTRKMPLMSARDWRKCLNLKANSDISFCISYPSSIEEHDSRLLEILTNECFPITYQKSIPWKKESLIGSMDKAYI
ncbi:hypothetical protein PFICI_14330 [Pestalotiopsis fici W106-1]|uniref:Nephrocystin 3-like N-terminal domain-containing protein n=1 Tax=Pestalotiopsis fici (strain W106-1 / CGMCC3.15140) TaxID=1229662 RepID=W3WL38_PESFW|nr:uncharacterized protein PFICI_14330 [Pestalotiopsis fici W106-1]ETS74464.1 hypothetical protein PFICI_14330 [Pestalotiopsis fici W106-1]